jgi:hypothetical protein
MFIELSDRKTKTSQQVREKHRIYQAVVITCEVLLANEVGLDGRE